MEQCIQKLRMPVWGWGGGAANEGRGSLEGRAFYAKKENEIKLTRKWPGMYLSNFKLSLTRAMERGKVGTLRSYDELIENAN